MLKILAYILLPYTPTLSVAQYLTTLNVLDDYRTIYGRPTTPRRESTGRLSSMMQPTQRQTWPPESLRSANSK